MKQFIIGFSILFITAISCTESTEVLNNYLPPHTLQVSEIDGVIGYWEHGNVDKFTIDVYVPNTIDSQITGIVEDLPSDFRTEGMFVIFSGEYKESNENPEPMLGGQSVYSLIVSSIKKK